MSNIEGSQWSVDNAESSDDVGKDRKKKKDDKAVNGRWIKPPLARSEGLSGFANERKSFTEVPVRPPLPLEKIISSVEDDDDDDEEEEKPEADSAAETTDKTVQDSKVAEQSAEQTFETMAEARDSGFMDIPQADAERPAATPTFEEILAREMPPDFAAATSGSELGGPDKTDVPPIPSWEMPTTEHPLGASEAPPSAPPARTTGTPFWRPSPPPAPFEMGGYAAPSGTESTLAPSSASSEGVSAGFTAALETLKAFTDLAELANNPNRLVAQVLTRVAVEGFLAQRRQANYNNEPLLSQQREEIARLHDEQRKTSERLASNAQQNVLGPNEQLEIFDQDGNRIVLQPGWQVKRSPAGYSFVVDRHNRVVHNAINYGEAFMREQRREQLSDDAFAAFGAGGSTTPDTQNNGGFAAPFPTGASQTQSTQSSSQYALPDHQVDINHRLPEPHNYLKSAIFSPWLWTAIAILIIIYFIAALA